LKSSSCSQVVSASDLHVHLTNNSHTPLFSLAHIIFSGEGSTLPWKTAGNGTTWSGTGPSYFFKSETWNTLWILAWLLKLVGNCTYFLQNFIQTIIPRAELGVRCRHHPDCCPLLQLQPDPVAFLEQHLPTFLILIFLHCDLGLNEVLSNVGQKFISGHQMLIHRCYF
jgi:hypothetical protein